MIMTNYEFIADAYKIPMREDSYEPDGSFLGFVGVSSRGFSIMLELF